jgi:hypothetical protein
MINKSDYLKNYGNSQLALTVEINGKKFDRGVAVNFDAESKDNFLHACSLLYVAAERAILKQNGYYDALQKELEQEAL